MNIYKEMYYRLFNTFTDLSEAIDKQDYITAARLIFQAQQDAEEMFLNAEDGMEESER